MVRFRGQEDDDLESVFSVASNVVFMDARRSRRDDNDGSSDADSYATETIEFIDDDEAHLTRRSGAESTYCSEDYYCYSRSYEDESSEESSFNDDDDDDDDEWRQPEDDDNCDDESREIDFEELRYEQRSRMSKEPSFHDDARCGSHHVRGHKTSQFEELKNQYSLASEDGEISSIGEGESVMESVFRVLSETTRQLSSFKEEDDDDSLSEEGVSCFLSVGDSVMDPIVDSYRNSRRPQHQLLPAIETTFSHTGDCQSDRHKSSQMALYSSTREILREGEMKPKVVGASKTAKSSSRFERAATTAVRTQLKTKRKRRMKEIISSMVTRRSNHKKETSATETCNTSIEFPSSAFFVEISTEGGDAQSLRLNKPNGPPLGTREESWEQPKASLKQKEKKKPRVFSNNATRTATEAAVVAKKKEIGTTGLRSIDASETDLNVDSTTEQNCESAEKIGDQEGQEVALGGDSFSWEQKTTNMNVQRFDIRNTPPADSGIIKVDGKKNVISSKSMRKKAGKAIRLHKGQRTLDKDAMRTLSEVGATKCQPFESVKKVGDQQEEQEVALGTDSFPSWEQKTNTDIQRYVNRETTATDSCINVDGKKNVPKKTFWGKRKHELPFMRSKVESSGGKKGQKTEKRNSRMGSVAALVGAAIQSGEDSKGDKVSSRNGGTDETPFSNRSNSSKQRKRVSFRIDEVNESPQTCEPLLEGEHSKCIETEQQQEEKKSFHEPIQSSVSGFQRNEQSAESVETIAEGDINVHGLPSLEKDLLGGAASTLVLLPFNNPSLNEPISNGKPRSGKRFDWIRRKMNKQCSQTTMRDGGRQSRMQYDHHQSTETDPSLTRVEDEFKVSNPVSRLLLLPSSQQHVSGQSTCANSSSTPISSQASSSTLAGQEREIQNHGENKQKSTSTRTKWSAPRLFSSSSSFKKTSKQAKQTDTVRPKKKYIEALQQHQQQQQKQQQHEETNALTSWLFSSFLLKDDHQEEIEQEEPILLLVADDTTEEERSLDSTISILPKEEKQMSKKKKKKKDQDSKKTKKTDMFHVARRSNKRDHNNIVVGNVASRRHRCRQSNCVKKQTKKKQEQNSGKIQDGVGTATSNRRINNRKKMEVEGRDDDDDNVGISNRHRQSSDQRSSSLADSRNNSKSSSSSSKHYHSSPNRHPNENSRRRITTSSKSTKSIPEISIVSYPNKIGLGQEMILSENYYHHHPKNEDDANYMKDDYTTQ
eukprot:scaffold2325_cov126-Cylindrotheca_fusiformis.AAC.4